MSRFNLLLALFCTLLCTHVSYAQDPSFEIVTSDTEVLPGDFVNIDINVQDFNDVVGYQFTFTWDPNVLLFNSIPSDYLGLPNMASPPAISNFGISQTNSGLISCLWEDLSTQGFDSADTTLFRIRFQALVPGETDVRIENSPTSAVVGFYNSNGDLIEQNLEVDSVKVTVNMPVSISYPYEDGNITIFQNEPNPFKSNTRIMFDLKNTEEITLNVLDLTGKIIYSIIDRYNAGPNSILLNEDIFQTAGTYIYQLQTEEKLFNNKLVYIR